VDAKSVAGDSWFDQHFAHEGSKATHTGPLHNAEDLSRVRLRFWRPMAMGARDIPERGTREVAAAKRIAVVLRLDERYLEAVGQGDAGAPGQRAEIRQIIPPRDHAATTVMAAKYPSSTKYS
jgi:hypothetical protein